MEKYQEIILKLKEKGVAFESPLSTTEIQTIEMFYNIVLPTELKNLLSCALPISKGFYNWRDMSEHNVKLINKTLISPLKELENELENDDFWCVSWGNKPNDIIKAKEILFAHYLKAPKLIPIYIHRYIPSIANVEEIPVFSIVGSDIICYGKNLISYLEIEFKIKERISNMNYSYVDFWSDLL